MVHSVVGEHLEQLGEDIVQSHVRSAPISYPSVDLSRRVCNLPRRYESTQCRLRVLDWLQMDWVSGGVPPCKGPGSDAVDDDAQHDGQSNRRHHLVNGSR